MRILFANENVHGHATMNLHLVRALVAHPEIEPSFYDVPEPSLGRRVVAAPWPGLGRLDLDLHPLRDQLSKSYVMRRYVKQLDGTPDALHLYTHNIGLLSASLLRKIPTVVSLDATNRQNAFRLPQRKPTRFTKATLPLTVLFERRVYGAARQIVTHSKWAADSVMSYGVPAAAIEVIPFGIELPAGAETARHVESDVPAIVFIGSSMERKGGWRLLRLWRESLADRSRLVLVTRDHVPSEPGLDVRSDIRPGDGLVEGVLRSGALFVFPSEIDAFGYAVLEAMAARLPVVAVGQGALPELVDDGVTGLLVPPGDDAALTKAISAMLDDPTARHEMGEAGFQRLCDRFDARVTTAALVNTLLALA
jgi:glycosyltransferase involved in cell wall biosynthesis